MKFATRPLAILMTLVLFNFVFTACGDDDDEPKKPDTEYPDDPDDDEPDYESLIVGTWEYEDDGYSQLMGFSPYNEFSFLIEDEDGYDLEQDFGTYSISGNKLKLKFDDGESATATIVSITKRKTLVLSADGEKITAKYVGAWDDYMD